MELYFNELSRAADQSLVEELLDGLYKCFKKAKNVGFQVIRIDKDYEETVLADGYTLLDLVKEPTIDPTKKSLLLSVFKRPYLIDTKDDQIDKYLSKDFYFENEEYSIERTECLGFGSAYVDESVSISLNSSKLWERCSQQIIIVDDAGETQENVLNICIESSLDSDKIRGYLYSKGRYKLPTTTLDQSDKNLVIPGDHHGQREHEKFGNKLLNSEFVIGVRSIENGGKQFIHSIEEDGKIRIVIPKTDSEYKLLVESTGRDLFETQIIAKKLEEKYNS